ncbi:MAG: hypothetical protein KAS72_00120 [Phycisphaerales bacterium]|nr:hypothetical protein [Phycisphaerales bacterium]
MTTPLHFLVRFSWHAASYLVEVTAASITEARRIVLLHYPGCTVNSARAIR